MSNKEKAETPEQQMLRILRIAKSARRGDGIPLKTDSDKQCARRLLKSGHIEYVPEQFSCNKVRGGVEEITTAGVDKLAALEDKASAAKFSAKLWKALVWLLNIVIPALVGALVAIKYKP